MSKDMTNKELLDKYVNACIELDREKMQYRPWRPKEVSLKEKNELENEIKKRMDSNWWHTGEPMDVNDYSEYVVRCYFEGDYQIRICKYCQPTHVFRDVYTEDVFELEKVIAWHKIEL